MTRKSRRHHLQRAPAVIEPFKPAFWWKPKWTALIVIVFTFVVISDLWAFLNCVEKLRAARDERVWHSRQVTPMVLSLLVVVGPPLWLVSQTFREDLEHRWWATFVGRSLRFIGCIPLPNFPFGIAIVVLALVMWLVIGVAIEAPFSAYLRDTAHEHRYALRIEGAGRSRREYFVRQPSLGKLLKHPVIAPVGTPLERLREELERIVNSQTTIAPKAI